MLLTKLHRPPISKEHVYRDHLINRLDKNLYKPFTLVSAGAGYGKSMLISSWLELSKENYGWISLDEDDNDIRDFVQYVIKSIQIQFPGTLTKSENLVNNSELPPSMVLWEELINEMDEIISSNFVLVLDDYHLIQESNIHDFINLFLKFPPQHMHLVLISRYDPPFDLPSLRAHNKMNEIRMTDLVFQPNDITNLFRKQSKIELSKELIDTLYKTTEGWIVGLRMASLAIHNGEEAKLVIDGLGKGRFNISEFLAKQVLMKQGEVFQELLLRVSIFERFSAQLINDIFVGDDLLSKISGEDLIDWLNRNNMFVIELDFEKKWFRFHHIFKDLLESQLRLQLSNELINSYYIKASNWFNSQNLVTEAIHCAQKASDYQTIADILCQRRTTELNSDNYRIGKWLEYVPFEIQKERPELLLIKAWVAFQNSRIDIIIEVLAVIDSNHSLENVSPAIIGEIEFFKGLLEYYSGNGELSSKYLESAIKNFGSQKNLMLGEIQLMYALSLVLTGEKDKAITLLKACVKSSEYNDILYLTRIYGGFTLVNIILGDLVNAKNTLALMRKNTHSSKSVFAITWGDYLSGWVALNSYEINEAIGCFCGVIEKRFLTDMFVSMSAYLGLINSYALSNRFDEAKNAIAELRNFIKLREISEFEHVADSSQVRLDLIMGKQETLIPVLSRTIKAYDPLEVLFWLDSQVLNCFTIHIKYGTIKDIEKSIVSLCKIRESIKTANFRCQELDVVLHLSAAFFKLRKSQEAQEYMSEALGMAEEQSWYRPFVEFQELLLPVLKERIDNKLNTPFITEIFRLTDQLNRTPENPKSLGKVEARIQKKNKLLTVRELEILKLVSEGYRNQEIADKIFISEGGVKKHLYRTFQKLDVKSRIELVKKGIEMNLIPS